MIRLPPTGIDISRDDLNFHLQQLDIYQGLLEQGFKKNEIVSYFKQQNLKSNDTNAHGTSDPVPSTFEFCKRSVEMTELESQRIRSEDSSLDPSHAGRSPSLSPENSVATGCSSRKPICIRSRTAANKSYAPRQSSLLQYSRGISPEVSSDDPKPSMRIPFSPRSNITYRPRSQTYSHEESEADENDLMYTVDSSLDDLYHLSLDDDLVPASADSRGTTVRIVSGLRPEAESFIPVSRQQPQDHDFNGLKGEAKADSSPISESCSMPSSPPVPEGRRSPSLPKMPRTPPEPCTIEPITAQRQNHHQYLDGSFTVYDDSIPARLQPRTPADLGHGRMLNAANAAFTAPPGRLLHSPLPLQERYLHGIRQPSGDQSPTMRALLIRERRQREFHRGARVEELRIDRIRTEETTNRAEDMQTTEDIWRDDLDADGVGEENFDELLLSNDIQRLRVVSGNRRG